MILAWVVFPLVLAALSLGVGLLIERIAGARLAGPLLLPVGFAGIVVVAGLLTVEAVTARAATPAVVALAVIGAIVSDRWKGFKFEDWPALSAVGVYFAFAAPIVLSGAATFAGWIKLDDGATWLAFVDRLMAHGRSVASLAPSTYQEVLNLNLGNGYPVGSFVALGVGHTIVRTDSAWLLQPYMAYMAMMLAFVIYFVATQLIRSSALRALIAFVAAQSALYYGFALWGGVKEVAAAPLVATAAVLVPFAARRSSVRSTFSLAVATAATLDVLTIDGAVWLGPALLVGAVMMWRAHGPARSLRSIGVFAGSTVVLAGPAVLLASSALGIAKQLGSSTGDTQLGNLLRPLKPAQVFGIWPAGDFRVNPHQLQPTYVLIAVAAAAAVGSAYWAWRRRSPELLIYVGTSLIGVVAIVEESSPWIGGKGLATASPAFLAAAMIGAAIVFERGRRVEGAVLLAAISLGVLWSNTLAYHDVWLAPTTQLTELQTIGQQFAGDGPALMTDYSPYGARHFLRKLDPESASEYRFRLTPLLDGSSLPKGDSADIDAFQTAGILTYRTLVLRRSATSSRPPSAYQLVWQGQFYDVWQRPVTGGPQVITHLPLGDAADPVAVPSCAVVKTLAKSAPAGTELATVVRPYDRIFALSTATRPPSWLPDPNNSLAVVPTGRGDIAIVAQIATAGDYTFWLQGSFRDHLQFLVDAKQVWAGSGVINWNTLYSPLGQTHLTRGRHLLLLRYSGPTLRPGTGGTQFGFGPLVLSRTTDESKVTYVSPSDAQSLCGKTLDWIEIVKP